MSTNWCLILRKKTDFFRSVTQKHALTHTLKKINNKQWCLVISTLSHPFYLPLIPLNNGVITAAVLGYPLTYLRSSGLFRVLCYERQIHA